MIPNYHRNPTLIEEKNKKNNDVNDIPRYCLNQKRFLARLLAFRRLIPRLGR